MSCSKIINRVLWNRRASCRQVIVEAGSVVTLQGPTSVLIQDISPSGAKVCGWRLPPVGKQLLLRIDGVQMLGSVAWSRFREAGLAFDTCAAETGVWGPIAFEEAQRNC
jgi:hypothetical protein